ncbi:peptidase inhibitor family I36 protein [Amycolatopsis tolypomycina]|uniref:peptidase inhibitor family I36 protein n=1 Tax=Amycolatopsis tolypomycina TaxID=208445 RepID=UPI0033BB9C51
MRFVMRTGLVCGAVAVAVGGLLTAPAEATASSWDDCPSQHVCFWTGDNGTGQMCNWSGDDPNWLSGSIRCSWARTTKAQSVWNRGTTGAPVSYYTGADYGGSRAGCTPSGGRGNFVGGSGTGYLLRSHRWAC